MGGFLSPIRLQNTIIAPPPDSGLFGAYVRNLKRNEKTKTSLLLGILFSG